MSMHDTPSAYGLVSRLNHWLGALVVIVMLAIGLYFHEMPRGDERSYWLTIHIGIGVLSFLFIAFRIYWRFASKSPQPAGQTVTLQKAAMITHRLLILTMIIMFISGPLLIWTGGRPISPFGLFSIPSPIPEMHDVHEFLEELHEIVSRVLLVLIIVHVVAVIKHLVLGSGTLRGRMWGKVEARR